MLGEKFRVWQLVPDVDDWIQPSGKVGGWSPRAQFPFSAPRVSGQRELLPFKVFGLSMRGLLSLSQVKSILDREQEETVTESRHPT